MVDGIILAGGYSSRIKKNKMTLIYNDLPIICNVIESMKDCCNKIVVVTGYYHEEVSEVVSKYKQVVVKRNDNYDLGMFSSVIAGVTEVNNDFFLTPGDYPLIRKETFKQLLDASGVIKVPIFNNRKGHPIFTSQELIEPLLNESIDSNLKVFRDRYTVNYIETSDEGVLIDVDTMEDYLLIKGKKERKDR
ncbi:MAG: nucleotidyltransferase family protein [Candidatus Izimaplasma sp.]|nr:nucleotidyltransferase family protein [Candidatus Izimaplasma bacterium]